jgi:hypothetical protein
LLSLLTVSLLAQPLHAARADDLHDLRLLLDHVKRSKSLILLQSKKVLERPWVIMELYTAIRNAVPIVALTIQNSYRYDYAAAADFLYNFDKDIDIANPGAAKLLVDHGVDPVDCAYLLSETLPNIISVDFNPNGSARQIQASLADLVEAMGRATTIAPSMTKPEWVAKRNARDLPGGLPGGLPEAKRTQQKPHSSAGPTSAAPAATAAAAAAAAAAATAHAHAHAHAHAAAAILADVPLSVPELPNAYLVREKDLRELKAALLAAGGPSSAALTSTKQPRSTHRTAAHGMGGVGKTTIAAAVVQDEGIRASFDRIVWVSVGQVNIELRHAFNYFVVFTSILFTHHHSLTLCCF